MNRLHLLVLLLAAFALAAPEVSDAINHRDGKGGFGRMGGKKGGGDSGGGSKGSGAPGLNPEVRDAFFAMRATTEAMDARGLFETGLQPVYPDGMNCQTGDSFFGADTRGDGSERSDRFYQSRHGGFDIPAKGIDIIAMADGEVI
jgi:hypothetical protein